MTYKHIIWDWNGTLWDDAELCTEVNNHMLARRNLPEITLETYQAKLCFPVSDYYDQLGFDYTRDTYETLAKEYIAEYAVRRFECPLRKGARELLDFFRDRQLPQAVLSAYEQTALQEAVDHYELAGYFDEVIGLNDIYAVGKVANGLAYIKQLNTAPSSVLFIGDTVHDFEVAQAMGVNCVLLSGGHNSRERLETCGVPIFESLHGIRDHIQARAGTK